MNPTSTNTLPSFAGYYTANCMSPLSVLNPYKPAKIPSKWLDALDCIACATSSSTSIYYNSGNTC